MTFQTVDTKYTNEPNATFAFTHLQGMRRVVRFQAGIYDCQCGSFLFGPMGRVDSITAFGPVDDFGNIVNLADLDTVEVSLI